MASKQDDIRSFFSRPRKEAQGLSNLRNDSADHITSRYTKESPSTTSTLDESLPKRSKHRESGFNSEWVNDFSWVFYSSEDNGMYCKLCRKFSKRPQKIADGHATWVDIACITFTRQSLKNHEASESHKEAMLLEAQLSSSGGIIQAFSNVESAGRKAMICAFRCLYWLCKQEIHHTTNFASLLQLGKSLGATYLIDLQVGGNAHYSSERFIQEAVTVLGSVVSNPIFEQMRASPFFSLMIDETTDVAVVKEVIVYARYLDQKRKVQTSFIAMEEIPDGCTDTIMTVVRKL